VATTGKKRLARRTIVVAAAGVVGSALVLGGVGLASAAKANDSVRVCKAGDLTTHIRTLDRAAGNRYAVIDFATKPGVSCTLTDNLTNFQFVDGKGHNLATAVRRAAKDATAIDMKPGDVAHLDLRWSVVSDTHVTPASLNFTLAASNSRIGVAWTADPLGGKGDIEVGDLNSGA
jgi:Domain of unknown function (DUF4232)